MKLGYTTWTWIQNERDNFKVFEKYEKQFFEQSLKDVSYLGYQVIENFNIIVNLYEDSPEEFNELLKKYGVEFVNVYHYLKEDFENELIMTERCCKFLRAHNANLLNIQTPNYVAPRGTAGSHATLAELDEAVYKLKRVATICNSFGVKLCLHPHYGKTVFLENEIDYVLSRIDPSEMWLTLDTAHTYLAGMNVPAAIKKYHNRIEYIHLKDYDYTKVNPDNPLTGFCALGRGEIDFRTAIEAILEIGYNDILTVECDYVKVNNFETAMTTKIFLNNLFAEMGIKL